MKRFLLSISLLIFLIGQSVTIAQNHVYSGSIGQYKIHMVLNKDMQGYYYYDKNPNSHFKLLVSSEADCSDSDYYYDDIPMDGCARITLQEYAPGTGKNSGEFIGFLLSKYRNGYLITNYLGTFRNKANGKTYSFEVGFSEKIE